MKWKAVLILCGALLMTGCIDFTRYKTGKVLQEGKKKLIVGEVLAINNSDESIGVVLPKVGISAGIGNGVEVGVSTNIVTMGVDIRKQIMYEENNGLNMTLEGGINTMNCTSLNGGFTISGTSKSGNEPYFGARYNKYLDLRKNNDDYDDGEFLDEDCEQLSNLQLTLGVKVPMSERFSVYPELNAFKFTEDGEGIMVILGIGTGFEF